ncbi:hypothetical protein AZ20_1395 [Bordetella bronchiseptica E014]|nr:hypothetical protein L576_1514 [Bordetella bronchiseptica OSU054]KAK66862.1 hypothetical protein L530_1499 [Bordetella bronchiseptica MO211]KAK76462.1 hypothetical protein L507_1489 [Bordetella bronchiseptica CA90 BB02]KCV40967.1 hypothetical protein L572_1622 [Bordetella bronchiseptica 345]KDB77589.1 hypothetical protein L494_1571 [Bordetella bronchiseptica CA90 BB1334]KDC23128.1 hypothetical protein AZ20_1395 [Bordetella bronchiseptica E014]KDC30063.1 hypothetical protein L505_1576 [Bord
MAVRAGRRRLRGGRCVSFATPGIRRGSGLIQFGDVFHKLCLRLVIVFFRRPGQAPGGQHSAPLELNKSYIQGGTEARSARPMAGTAFEFALILGRSHRAEY